MRYLVSVMLAVSLLLLQSLEAKNPIDSPTFDDIIKDFIQDQKYIFDDKNIKIKVPSFADNPVQVPIFVDAKKIKDAKEMIVFADLNPVPLIAKMETKNILPVFASNIKVAQETPLRAMIKDGNGLWHIASANIHSNGGGCDVSSQASNSNSDFAKMLGKRKGKLYKKGDITRIKASIFHPMETGLLFGTSEFYINKLLIQKENKDIAQIQFSSVISENPRFIFEFKGSDKEYTLIFSDTDANEFELDIR